jgi:hypothetical protein
MTDSSPVRSTPRPSGSETAPPRLGGPPRLGESSPVRAAWTAERSPRSRTAEIAKDFGGSRRPSWKKEIDNLEDELEKIKGRGKVNMDKTESKLKLEAWNEASKMYNNNINNGDIVLDIKRPLVTTPTTTVVTKPAFESKYRTMENKIDAKRFRQEQAKINENLPKKGSWRKDFAKFEDELEIDKIRKENQKKIELFAKETDCEIDQMNPQIDAGRNIKLATIDFSQNSEARWEPTKNNVAAIPDHLQMPLSKPPR